MRTWLARLRLWPRSLTFRVIAFSTIWAILTLVVIFTLITTLYRQASERGFDSLLSAHLFNLIGSVGISDNGALTGSPDLGDLRFSEPNSGWYFQRSYSTEGIKGEDLEVFESEFVLDAKNRAARFRVMGNHSELEQEIASFQRRLLTYLSLFGVGMIAINAIAILLGLQPLRRVRNALAMV
ncbi:MAG: histidine kinase, partial [Mesorhizobium sp.]